jgi:Asp-tRNA(Asn)/Glu-tRNA(Gln) amidotransferase A subunit family amidase
VETFIAQLERVNPLLNAICADRFAAAREEASECDKIVNACSTAERKNLPSLFGVPIVIKECMQIEGMPYTAGLVSRARAREVGQEDATAVGRLYDQERGGGMIVLCVANVSEGKLTHCVDRTILIQAHSLITYQVVLSF